MLKRLSLGEKGDTIVEVMIVLAVLGLAIGISYATANRSLLNARQAQENSQASELTQSQVEQLRALSSANCTTPPVDTAHCIYGTSGTAGHPFCLVNGVVTAVTDPGCNQAGEAGRYSLSITRQDPSDTFTVVAQWADVLGEGTDTVTTSYQLPPTPLVGGGGGGASVCPANSTGYTDQTVTGRTNGAVWGTGPYTADSDVGTAAVHAGLISPGQIATIRVCALPGQGSYGSSTAHGVTTHPWGAWPASISLIFLN